MTTWTVPAGEVRIAPAAALSAWPQSLFTLMQKVMDAQIWDMSLRTQALTSLLAYHAATEFADKASAVRVIEQMRADAIEMLDHMWGVYTGGVMGVYSMPVDSPAAGTLSEIVSTVATTRTAKTLPPLKVQH